MRVNKGMPRDRGLSRAMYLARAPGVASIAVVQELPTEVRAELDKLLKQVVTNPSNLYLAYS